MFASLAVPNYRRYFVGQVVSASGNWMQRVAELWLVVQLTGSGVSVGLTAALQFLPVLLFSPWGGLLADRLPKRDVLTATQALMTLPAIALWLLTANGHVTVGLVYAAVLFRGTLTAVDNPTRHSFVSELVGPDRVVNAVGLNNVIVYTARVLGPAAAGVAIATLGVAECFLVNSFSFVVLIVALRRLDPAELHDPVRTPRERGQLRSGMRHVMGTPALRIPLTLMAVIGTLSYNFQVLLPLIASETWNGSAATYASLTAVMGAGAVAGALATSARGRVGPRLIAGTAVAFGAVQLLVAGAPTFEIQLAVLVALGAASVAFAASVTSALQLAAAPEMRGRVMALYTMLYLGTTPIGAPLVGWLAEAADPRAAIVPGGVAAIAAGLWARVAYARAAVGGELCPTRGT